MKKKFAFLLMSILLTSCSTNTEIKPSLISKDVDGYLHNGEFIFPLNTITTLSMYYKDKFDEVYPSFNEMVISLSKQMDRYNDYDSLVNLKTINDSCGTNQTISVSNELFEIVSLAVKLTKLTEGRFNLAMGNIIDLYSPIFESGVEESSLPSQELIDNALSSIPSYTEIDEIVELDSENKTIKLNQYNESNVVISLGAIAKGFVMQKAYEYLKGYGYDFLFDSGSSTIAMYGKNQLKESGDWTIGFYNPSLEKSNEYLSIITLTGENYLSTSGDYQQKFFYEDENNNKKLMHHIVDPSTGISNDYLRSISLISNNCSLAVLDALSTTLFNVENDNQLNEMVILFEETFNTKINYVACKKASDNNYNDVNLIINKDLKSSLNSFASNVKNVTYK